MPTSSTLSDLQIQIYKASGILSGFASKLFKYSKQYYYP